MRRFLLAVAMIAVAIFSIAAAQETTIRQAPVDWGQVAIGNGEVLYAELCASCHGIDATGNGPAAPALKTPPTDLTVLAKMNGGSYPAEAVQKSITGEGEIVAHGTPGMPIWGAAIEGVRPDYKPARREWFANQRIGSLTAYLETIQVE